MYTQHAELVLLIEVGLNKLPWCRGLKPFQNGLLKFESEATLGKKVPEWRIHKLNCTRIGFELKGIRRLHEG